MLTGEPVPAEVTTGDAASQDRSGSCGGHKDRYEPLVDRSADPTWAGRRAPCPASFRSGAAAQTWCWPSMTRRCTTAGLPPPHWTPSRSTGRTGSRSGYVARGPVPHITEEFTLTEPDVTTRLGYSGELGTDFAAAGQWWADRVAAAWEAAVRSSSTSIQADAERRASPGTAKPLRPASRGFASPTR
jgi:hypothetical protein